MLKVIIFAGLALAVWAATTVAPAAPMILYDQKHHKAMIVKVGDGCYEYHMNHQDTLDSNDPTLKAVLEARMLQELSMAINIVETGHHHIDHMTPEIITACASIPVFSWEVGTANDTAMP